MTLNRIDGVLAPRAAWLGMIAGGITVTSALILPVAWWWSQSRLGMGGPGGAGGAGGPGGHWSLMAAMLMLVSPQLWVGLGVFLYHRRGLRPNLERVVAPGRLDRYARFQLLGRLSAVERRAIWRTVGSQPMLGRLSIRALGVLVFLLVPLMVFVGSHLSSHLPTDLGRSLSIAMLVAMIAAAIPIFTRLHAGVTADLLERHPTACRRCSYDAGHEADACPECGQPMGPATADVGGGD